MDSLKQIVSRVLNIDSINENVSRNNTEEWDSFNHLLLISEIEKELGVWQAEIARHVRHALSKLQRALTPA